MNGLLIALVGPSGVGKGYAKNIIKSNFSQIKELFVYTTRKRRESDLNDRVCISTEEFLFLKNKGEIIGAHKPFGENADWYGFSRDQIDKYLNKKEIVLTELHLDNIVIFKELFKNKLYLISLTANHDYLESNLNLRNSENYSTIKKRLDFAKKEVSLIYDYYNISLIDKLIELNFENRDYLSNIIYNEINNLIK